MKEQYLKFYSKVLNNIIFQNPYCWKIFTWILLKCNKTGWKENKFFPRNSSKAIIVKKGSFITSLSNKMKDELNMDYSTIKQWLTFLEKEGIIEVKVKKRYTIIKIKNWEKYQENKGESNGSDIFMFGSTKDKSKDKPKDKPKPIHNNNIINNKIVETKVSTPIKKFLKEDEELVVLFYTLLKSNNPSTRHAIRTESQRIKDLEEMNKINRLDGKPYEEIKAILIWCQKDNFWKTNILSISKFRKQYDRLFLQTKIKTKSNDITFA